MKAGMAYLVLPVTGLAAFLLGAESRTRFHGLQAIVLGTLWPIALYAAALGPPVVVQVVFVAGVVVWLAFLAAAFLGRDPRLPGAATTLERLAATPFRDVPRNTSGN